MAGLIGRRIGKVSVELLLSRSETAEIYLGRHAGLQRSVAVKILRVDIAEKPEAIQRFRQEAKAVGMLAHPNIAQIHEYDILDGHPFIVMEYVPGIDLKSHMIALRAPARIEGTEAIARLLSDTSAALQFAHARGVVHGDVKPANMLLTSASVPLESGKRLPADFRTVLTDFGSERFLRAARQDAAEQPVGTAGYMSPEQATGSPGDLRSDIYALGVVLYELLAGHRPFDGTSAAEMLQVHMKQALPTIEGLSSEVQEVLNRALDRDPANRFSSARELADAYQVAMRQERQLGPHQETDPIETVKSGASERGRARGLRSWLYTAVVATAVIALAAILGVRFLISAPTTPAAAGPTQPQATIPAVAAAGDPVGVLRFQDGASFVDEVSFNATGMPSAPENSTYEVWLVTASGEERLSVGHLALDPAGEGSTSFVDAQGNNLLARYSGMEITVEPDPDESPNPSSNIGFSTQLPQDGLVHVRHLLVTFSGTPDGGGLLPGLLRATELLSAASREMLDQYEGGDEGGTRSAAEEMLNLLLGDQSPAYSDWDGDGAIESIGDGYGLLLNGDQSGYIQGALAHAEFAVSSQAATDNMQSHGEHVMISARNLEGWAAQLQGLLEQIVTAPFDPAMGGVIRQTVALSDTMYVGTDLNGNERIEPIPGEGGAQTAYQHALYMADMVVTLSE